MKWRCEACGEVFEQTYVYNEAIRCLICGGENHELISSGRW